MESDVVFEDFGHQTSQGATDSGEEHQKIATVFSSDQVSLERVQLSPKLFDAHEEFRLFSIGM